MVAIGGDVDLGRFIRPLPAPSPSLSDLSHHVFSGDFRRAAKDAFYLATGNGAAVDGIGFEVVGLEALTPKEQGALSVACDGHNAGLPLTTRIERAAIRTKLELGEPLPGETQNQHLVRYLKDIVEPGDVVLVSCGGKAEGAGYEIFENFYRRLAVREAGEDYCPFSHAIIVDADKNLLHITQRGVTVRSWERLFLEREVFEGIALLRLNIPQEERLQMAHEATEFSVGREFNSLWAGLVGPLTQLAKKIGIDLPDTSAKHHKAICADFVTESARALSEKGISIPPDLLASRIPRDLLAARGLSLVAVGVFNREG